MPSLIFVELANTLSTLRGLTPIDVINAARALEALRLRVVEATSLLDKAVEAAFNHSIIVYDALYAALAMSGGSGKSGGKVNVTITITTIMLGPRKP